MDDEVFHNDLYALAFFSGGSQALAEQEKWYAGKPEYENHILSLSADTEAYAGHLRRARELTKRAVDSAIHADSKEGGAVWQAIAAQREAVFGNPAEPRRLATEALKLAPASQGVEIKAALAFAMIGNDARTESLVRDLGKRVPLDTQMQSLWLPAIQARVALSGAQKSASAALHTLQASTPVEFGVIAFAINGSCLYAAYVRGEAYLAAGQGSEAAAEFQKILDHSASSGTAGRERSHV